MKQLSNEIMKTMEISPKQYGEVLYQSVQSKKDSQIKGVLDNFAKLLIDNNDISKIDRIIGRFEKIWNKEEGIIDAEVVSARELDKTIVKLLNGHIAELSGARKVLLKQKINKNVLGGVVIKYGDRVLDASLKTQLKELKENLIK